MQETGLSDINIILFLKNVEILKCQALSEDMKCPYKKKER